MGAFRRVSYIASPVATGWSAGGSGRVSSPAAIRQRRGAQPACRFGQRALTIVSGDLPGQSSAFRGHLQVAITLCGRTRFAAGYSRRARRLASLPLDSPSGSKGGEYHHVPRSSLWLAVESTSQHRTRCHFCDILGSEGCVSLMASLASTIMVRALPTHR
jgi:hypothetical protein